MPTHEQIRLNEFLAANKPREIASYIARTPKIQKDILDFYGPELDIQTLVSNLKSKNRDVVDGVRELLDDYLEKRRGKLPVSNIPVSVRRISSVDEAKENFRLGKEAMKRGNIFKAGVDWLAAIGSTAGLTVRERQLATALGVQVSLLGLFSAQAQAAVSQNDINSALNDFNAAPQTDTISGSSYFPLRITVDGANLQGQFNAAIPMTNEGGYLYSPYLVQKMEKSAKARQYIEWINEEAAKNNINPVILGNQLFRETVHFNPKYIYGPEMSDANAMGMGQFIESTGNQYGLYTTEDFFDPQKSIAAAAKHMRDLLNNYNEDYVLALAAYNGGPGAVDTARKQLGINTITGKQWLAVMDARYEADTERSNKAWHVQSREYVGDILNINWNESHRRWAIQLQGTDAVAFATTGRKKVDAPMPTPLALRPQGPTPQSNG